MTQRSTQIYKDSANQAQLQTKTLEREHEEQIKRLEQDHSLLLSNVQAENQEFKHQYALLKERLERQGKEEQRNLNEHEQVS